MEEFDHNTYKAELKEFKERQDILKSKMWGVLDDISILVRSEADKENVADDKANAGDNNGSDSSSEGGPEYGMEDTETYAVEYGENVTATNELSRYIAEALLSGKEYILFSEYYHMNGSCYSVKEIAGAFAKELAVSKQAVLRTETELDNAGFQEIVHEVMERMGDVKLKGYYRLGVVYLERVSDDCH